MKRAWIGLRELPHYRRDAFAAGAQRMGYVPTFGTTLHPDHNDILVIWNRFGPAGIAADAFERAGLPVLVAENGYLGNDFAGDRWYALSRNHHNGAGTWPARDASRWERLHVDLKPWRYSGTEVVLLPQRSIGEQGIAMPHGWSEGASRRINIGLPNRVRNHPGVNTCVELDVDLVNAAAVYTWGSGAAIKALVMGIPVVYDFDNWIGAQAAAKIGEPLKRDDIARRQMFERLAWAQWSLSEIEDGTALEHLL